MLTAADLAGALPDMIARNVDMAARLGIGHRRHKRLLGQKYAAEIQGEHVIAPGDFRATEMLIAAEDEASQLCAETADLLEAVRAYFADQNERRPAPVLRLVPREEPVAVPAPQSAGGVLAKVFTGLFGSRAAKVA